jgi:hypothetical protein
MAFGFQLKAASLFADCSTGVQQQLQALLKVNPYF